MNMLKSNNRQQLLICLIMAAILCMTRIVFAIEPIAMFGQPAPEKHAFLTNETLVRTSRSNTTIQIVKGDTREIIDEFGSRPKYSYVVFSPNTTHVAILEEIAHLNKTKVKIWDVKARELRSEWETPIYISDRAEFSPVHPWLVDSNNNEIYVWNWQTGELIGKMIGERRPWKECSVGEVKPAIGKSVGRTCSSGPSDRDFEITPDGKYLIVASTRPDIELWNLETRNLIGHFEGNISDWVTGLTISADGRYLASFEGQTNIVYLWDVDTRQLIWKEQINDDGITDVVFSPNSQHLYVSHEYVYIFDVTSGQHVDTFGNDNARLEQMILSPDGQIMLLQSGGFFQGGVVELWDTENRQLKKVFTDYFGGIPKISSDGKTLVSIESFFIKVWDIPTQKVRFVIPGLYHFEKGVAISADNKRIAYSKYPRVEIANIQNGEVEVQTQDLHIYLDDAEFSPSGRWLAGVEAFGYLFVWDLINPGTMRRIDYEFPKERHFFKSVAFSENDTYLAATAVTGEHNNYKYWILVWERDGDNYKLLHRWETQQHDNSSYSSLSYSALTFATLMDGTTVLAIAAKGESQIWKILPGTIQHVSTLPGVTPPIHFGHDKRYLFTNQDGNLQVWDWKTGRTIKFASSRRYHGLSRDGSYLVSMEKTGQYHIWDAKALVSSLPYSVEPKGKQLVTLGQIKRNQLLQNYPNPFNPETWIPFKLADQSLVTIEIYSSTGELIRTLTQGSLKAGDYSSQSDAIHWDGQNDEGESVSSGIYFYTINAGDFSATRKMLIRK